MAWRASCRNTSLLLRSASPATESKPVRSRASARSERLLALPRQVGRGTRLGARGRELEFDGVGPASGEEPAGTECQYHQAALRPGTRPRSRQVPCGPRQRRVHPVEQLPGLRDHARRIARQGVVVGREIAVGGDHGRHAGGAARLYVALGIAGVHAAPGGMPIRRAACSSGRGCGLRSGSVSPLTHAGGARPQVQRLEQRLGQPARLVGHDAPGHAVLSSVRRAQRRPREEPRAAGEIA